MFMRGDLPDPEGPITATKSPAGMSRSTSARPTTFPAPASYTRQTPRRRRRGSRAAADPNAAPRREVLDLQAGDHVLTLPQPGEDLRPLPVRNPRDDVPAGDAPLRDDVDEFLPVAFHHRCGGDPE